MNLLNAGVFVEVSHFMETALDCNVEMFILKWRV